MYLDVQMLGEKIYTLATISLIPNVASNLKHLHNKGLVVATLYIHLLFLLYHITYNCSRGNY